MPGTLTHHQATTWFELVRLIKARLSRNSHKAILYGDLAESIFGARNIGAQSFANPLGEIHSRTKAYNRRMHSHHPSLNALVFNLKGQQPGIPEKQNPARIWKILESNGPRYLDRLGVFLGYEESKRRTAPKKQTSANAGLGPTGGGTRSPAVWEARHSPLTKEIIDILEGYFKCTPREGSPWKPDILMKSPKTDQTFLVEVKPDSSSHNVITAIGQILCYRSKLKNVTSIIAAPGIGHVGSHLKKVIETHQIETVDLDLNLRKQLINLCD